MFMYVLHITGICVMRVEYAYEFLGEILPLGANHKICGSAVVKLNMIACGSK
jgi:hypothetical protein